MTVSGQAAILLLRKEFGRELRRLRNAANLTQEALARRMGYHRVSITQVEQGRQDFSRQFVARAEAVLDARGMLVSIHQRMDIERCSPDQENSGVGSVGSMAALVRAAADDSSLFIRELSASSNRSMFLEWLRADVQRVSVAYLTEPPRKCLDEVRALRQAALRVLRGERKPTDDKDLLLLTGYLSGVLAYVALDLGFAEEAVVNARAAWLAADLSGHNVLRAWVRGTESLIARWKGDYSTAYDFIESGLGYAGGGTSMIRLLCGKAQCLAQLGDSAGTHRTLNRAKDEHERLQGIDEVSGLYGFPPAKRAYYAASSLIWLPAPKDARAAVRESQNALALWRTGPPCQRSNADEMLAHVYLATARLHLGELEGVLDAIQPVLLTPNEKRVSWLGKRLQRIAILSDANKRYRGSRTVDHIHREIDAFCASVLGPDAPAL